MSNTNSRKPEQEHPPPPSESVPDEWEISNFTCEICIEPMSPPNEQFTNNGLCVHPFCKDCITKYIQVKVEHEHIAEIKCPGLNCHKWLDPICCSTLIPPKLLEKWCDLLCERSLLGLDRCYCPNRLCSALVVNECGGIVKRSTCPDCNKLFCFFCKLPWHPGYRCEESGALRDKDDVAFALLSEKNRWMRCPQCGHCVELVYGCSVINCRCGSSFCYKCGTKAHQLIPHQCVRNGNKNHEGWIRWALFMCFLAVLSFLLAFLCNNKYISDMFE